MKAITSLLRSIIVIAVLETAATAQPTASTATAPSNALTVPEPATVPIQRLSEKGIRRSELLLQRAKDAIGQYDVEFIGDSITERWETTGKNVWQEFYGHRRALNFGVGGDRTQHVLWRIEHGQLDRVKCKVAVVMIGTNNTKPPNDNSEADILAGVTAIVNQIRERQPDTKILLCAIFPRGQTFCEQRGKILQVNQALARLDDKEHITYLDFGSLLVEDDGSISKNIMPDYLHLSEGGYRIWADAIEQKLKEILGE